MKRSFLSLLVLAVFSLAISTGLRAQENSNNQVIVIQKATSDDGATIIKKKRFDRGESPDRYIDELKLNSDIYKKMELTLITDGDEADADNAETLIYIRSNGDGGEEVIVKGNWNCDDRDDDEDFDFNFDFDFDDDHHHHHYAHHAENKALIGIYPGHAENGVRVNSLVYSGGAEAAGIQAGDVLTAIDGESLNEKGALHRVLSNYQPGDQVAVDFLRDGQSHSANITLTERKKTLHKRNPCKVFIGVSLGSSSGEGIRITGIIDGWPAEEMALEAGDEILAMDGVRIGDFNELLTERNKHKPGEPFTLTILRNDETFEVDGQFKECPKEEEVQPEPQPEPTPTPLPQAEFTDNLLDLEGFNAYPNPTWGKVNVRFQGEAVPTVVTVNDVNGKQVFQEKIQDFSGYYAKEINVANGAPGTMTLSVQQGDRIQSKPLILLNRA